MHGEWTGRFYQILCISTLIRYLKKSFASSFHPPILRSNSSINELLCVTTWDVGKLLTLPRLQPRAFTCKHRQESKTTIEPANVCGRGW